MKYSITFDKRRTEYSESFIKWVTNSKNKIILKDSHEIKINHEIDDAKKQLFDIINSYLVHLIHIYSKFYVSLTEI